MKAGNAVEAGKTCLEDLRILVVEDDFISRKLLQTYLAPFGKCDIACNGGEAEDAFKMALYEGTPYDLICLDVMMPVVDGRTALKRIREIEREHGISPKKEVKVIMTTALDSPRDVVDAYYRSGCTSYLVKPITKEALLDEVKALFS